MKGNYGQWLCVQADEKRDHVEVCAEGGVILEHMAARLEEDGGLALFADYGHDGTKMDTFRVRFTTYSEASNYFNDSVCNQGLQIHLNLDLSSS
jgi:SAM-dependent MidA family methyltransferase